MNNIVVKSASETKTLSSIDDLNNFLSTIENKKILIISYVDISQELILQKYNIYFIFGKYFYRIFLQSKVFLYVEAYVGEISNSVPNLAKSYDISGSTIIARFSDITILSSNDITLIVEKARAIDLVHVYNSKIFISNADNVGVANFSGVAYIRAYSLTLSGELTDYFFEVLYNFYLSFTCIGDTCINIGSAYLTQIYDLSLTANSSYTMPIYIPDGILPDSRIFVFISGADNISYSVNINAKTITYTNNNPFNVNINVKIIIMW